jgi:cytochrome c biogenesis protein CcmG, thiol:disulfide interchange protein DsbE
LRTVLLAILLAIPSFLCAQQEEDIAPDFTLTDLQGGKLNLADYKGKVILLDFWATWCVPCQTEIPRFIEWQKKHGAQGFQVIGISMDDDESAARAFVKRYSLNYPVAMGTEKLAESYGGVLGLPANIIIDRQGRILSKHVGETDLTALEDEIKSQIKQRGP